jgi:DNA repair exonuclease SbcCD nuclease subunit
VSRVVVSSDWHVDAATYGVQRLGDVSRAVHETVDSAVVEKADLYLFLGDLSDPDDGPWALQAAAFSIQVATRLARNGIPSWWVAGNHDVVEDGTGMTTLSPLRALDLPEVRVFEVPELAPIPGRSKHSKDPVQLLALPYTATSRAYEPRSVVAHHRDAMGERAVVAGHLQLEGIHPGEETTEMPRGRDVRFPIGDCRPGWLKLNGHYHERQVHQGVHIPGSVVRLSFGEQKNRPGFLLFEV